jgi:hypothetical protein
MSPVEAPRTASTRERKAPKTLRHIEIKEAENGGHIITHQFEHYEHPAEEHVFGEKEGHEALTHIAEHMNIKHDMKSEPEAEDETGGSSKEQNA